MPKIVDPLERRAHFIAASREVVAEHGYGAATMRRVATAAGCTTGALTHYFSDRQSLLIETLRAAHKAAGARMLAAIAGADSDFDRLKTVLLESLPLDTERMQEWSVWLAFWAASTSDPILATENANRYREWRAMVLNLMAPLCDEAEAETDLLIAVIDGLGLRLARCSNTDSSLPEHQAECRASITRYLTQFEV